MPTETWWRDLSYFGFQMYDLCRNTNTPGTGLTEKANQPGGNMMPWKKKISTWLRPTPLGHYWHFCLWLPDFQMLTSISMRAFMMIKVLVCSSFSIVPKGLGTPHWMREAFLPVSVSIASFRCPFGKDWTTQRMECQNLPSNLPWPMTPFALRSQIVTWVLWTSSCWVSWPPWSSTLTRLGWTLCEWKTGCLSPTCNSQHKISETFLQDKEMAQSIQNGIRWLWKLPAGKFVNRGRDGLGYQWGFM